MNTVSRRAFLERSATLAGLAGAAPLVNSLGLVGEAAALEATDYKAIVCIFLNGGNDNANTLIPFDNGSYARYNSARPSIALSHGALMGTLLNPRNDMLGRQFALNPALSAIKPLFDIGNLAILPNIGVLTHPLTKADFLAGSTKVPPFLFSHNSQTSMAQTNAPFSAKSGWAGRIGDLVANANGTATLTCISANGSAIALTGQSRSAYAVGKAGALTLLSDGLGQTAGPGAAAALRSIMTGGSTNPFSKHYSKISQRALELAETVNTAIRGTEASIGNFSDETLSTQLRIVARLIAGAPVLGIKRQVFYVSLGGFDTHSNLTQTHTSLLWQLGKAMRSFYDAMVATGNSGRVTTFTASEFGRTLSSNGDGTDHGWGGVHFVMGGAVRGGRIIGPAPEYALGTLHDVGQGRLLPTTSFDQLAASLGLWFGLNPSDLAMISPNLSNFDPASWDLGIL